MADHGSSAERFGIEEKRARNRAHSHCGISSAGTVQQQHRTGCEELILESGSIGKKRGVVRRSICAVFVRLSGAVPRQHGSERSRRRRLAALN